MSYATLDNLKSRLGSNVSATNPGLYQQLTDRVAATTGNDTVGQALVNEAEADVNKWIAKRYATPVDVTDATTAQVMNAITLDLAEYGAWVKSSSRKTLPTRVKQAFDAAMAWLKDVAAGTADIPGETAPAAASSTTAEAAGYTRIFTEDSFRGA